MRYAVTGGAGFIGSHLTKQLLKNGHNVIIIDNLHSGKKENIDKAIDKPGNNDESVILGLYGKQTYKGSNRWLYYVISEKNSIKIPLKIEDVDCTSDNRGCKELMNGDTINVPQYNGEFQVNIYKFDAPRYIPYV